MGGAISRGEDPSSGVPDREATNDYSTGLSPRRASAFELILALIRLVVVLCVLLACALLIAAESSTLYMVKVIEVIPPGGRITAGSHHGDALLIVGIVAAVFALGLLRVRWFGIGLIALGLVAVGVVIFKDHPDIHSTGLIGQNYDQARATPGAGWHRELVGSVLLLAGGVLGTVLGAPFKRRPPAAPSADG